MTATHLPLAGEFPPADRAQWLALVERALAGAPFDKKLVHETCDGLRIQPLYPRARDAHGLAGRRGATPWQVVQRLDSPDAAAANLDARHDLENGATGLSLVFAGATGALGYGLAPAGLARVLEGIFIEAIALELDPGSAAEEIAGALLPLLRSRSLAPGDAAIRFGFDPVGALAAGRPGAAPWPIAAPRLAQSVRALAGEGFTGPFAAADGRVIHNAGGSEAQELAFALAAAVTYLRTLETGGIPLDAARRMLFFRLSADADQFLTIAKFRALRMLWARVEDACGLPPEPLFLSAETAWRMMTRRDPWVNMLRATVAVAAAGLGGADAVAVLPYTAALAVPDRAARRVARNTQLILLEESHLARVADPAAGSGAVESLTREMCAAAWSQFQEIEKAGGIAAALASGLVQRRVAEVRAKRRAAVARRKDALTGTSEFPDLNEPGFPLPASGERELSKQGPASPAFEPLPRIRLAAPFEALRDASDRMRAQAGQRPKVFLANLGRLSDFTARATFAQNFFAAGGIEAITNDGFSAVPLPKGERSTTKASGEGEQASSARHSPSPGPSPSAADRPLPAGEVNSAKAESRTDLAALVAAFRASGAKLACLCSSDAVYANEAVAAAEALAAAGAGPVYLAGRPGEQEAALKKAGVNAFIYAGCDVLATLQAAHESLGLAARTSDEPNS